MTPDEYARFDATALIEGLASRQFTQSELLSAAKSSIEQLNPDLNAVIEIFDEPTPATTDDTHPKTLLGLPWLLKDIGAGEPGRKQEQGSRLLKDFVVEEETELSRRFRISGMINLGRTAVPEFAYDANTESLLSGQTRNPWKLDHSAGGSSGGAAAAVASGMVPAAHASDGGGSIRIPAAFNGLLGLKPTRGRISTWPIFVADRPLGHATEFAVCHTVRDMARLLDAFHGNAHDEPQTLPLPESAFASFVRPPSTPLRIALCCDNSGPHAVAPEVRNAVEATARILQSVGHHVEEAYPMVDYTRFATAMSDLWAAEISSSLTHLAEQTNRPLNNDNLEANALGLIERAATIKGTSLFEALLVQDECTYAFHSFFSDYDVLLTPTTCTTAPPLGQTGPFTQHPWVLDFNEMESARLLQYTYQANASGQPALSVPAGLSSDGLPIGVQLQAAYGREDLLIQIACLLEESAPWREDKPAHHQSTR